MRSSDSTKSPSVEHEPDKCSTKIPKQASDPSTFRIRLSYLLALGLIGILFLGSYVAVNVTLQRQAADGAIINVAGRQRMLSQKITKAAVELIHAKSFNERQAALKETQSAIGQWNDAYQSLSGGDATLGQHAVDHAHIQARYDELGPKHIAMTDSVQAAIDILHAFEKVDAQTNDPVTPEALLSRVNELRTALIPLHATEATFLKKMNELVGEHEAISKQNTARLQRDQLIMSTTAITVLFLIAFIIFEPLTRRLGHQYAELIQQRNHLEKAESKANAANAAKSAFLANMSHEIRTPIAAINGYAVQIQGDDVSKADRLHALSSIERNGKHLLSIINDILDISKIESGKTIIESQDCSLVEIVSSVRSVCHVKAAEKQLDLRFECQTEIPKQVHTDSVRLRQILINLIGNAVKFTEKGQITVRIGFNENPKPVLTIEVQDTGIGMNAEQVERVFKPFEQADESTTRRFGGTGLGLTISRQLAQGLGGELAVSSQPDVGSCFIVTIDAGSISKTSERIADLHILESHEEDLPTNGQATADGQKQLPLEGITILLAEDDRDLQRLMRYHLKKLGASYVLVDNGASACRFLLGDAPTFVNKIANEEAKETINAAPGIVAQHCHVSETEDRPENIQPEDIHLVLMDMQMPLMDGYTATQTLRQAECAVPVIALTAHAMSGDRERCITAGCDEFATKPANMPKLIKKIHGLVSETKEAQPQLDANNASNAASNAA